MFDQVNERILYSHLSLYFEVFDKESFFVYQMTKLMELFLYHLHAKKATSENVFECIRNAAEILHQNPIPRKGESEKLLSAYELVRQKKQVVKKAMEIISEAKKLSKDGSNSTSNSTSNTQSEEESRELEEILRNYKDGLSEENETNSRVLKWIEKEEWKQEWIKAFGGKTNMEKMKMAVLRCMIKHKFSIKNLEEELSNVERKLRKAAKRIMKEVITETRL